MKTTGVRPPAFAASICPASRSLIFALRLVDLCGDLSA